MTVSGTIIRWRVRYEWRPVGTKNWRTIEQICQSEAQARRLVNNTITDSQVKNVRLIKSTARRIEEEIAEFEKMRETEAGRATSAAVDDFCTSVLAAKGLPTA